MPASTPTDRTPRPLAAGARFPALSWSGVEGETIRTDGEGWRVLVVYRGKHCDMCRRYLIELNGLCESFAKLGVAVAAVSADERDAAAEWQRSLGLQFPLGHGLTPAQMQALGLYVSPPDDDVAHAFAEPAVFVLRDDSRLHFACVANAPYGRPPLHDVLEGVRKAIEDDLPPHGTQWPG
jgi:peroxiredoxin